MELTRSQNLLMHNVLFNFLVTHQHLSIQERHDIEDIMALLEESLFMTPEKADHGDHDYDDEEVEEEEFDEDDEASHAEIYVDLGHFVTLPSVRVVNADDGKRSTLTFCDFEGVLCFELSSKDQLETVEDVRLVTRKGKSLEIETRDEVFNFHVSKFPAEWTDSLTLNKSFGV